MSGDGVQALRRRCGSAPPCPASTARASRFGPAYSTSPAASRNTQPSRCAVAITPRMRASAGSAATAVARAAPEHVPERDRIEVEAAHQRQVGIGEEVIRERLLRRRDRPSLDVEDHAAAGAGAGVEGEEVVARHRSASAVEHGRIRDPARPLAAQPALHRVHHDVALVSRHVDRGAAEVRRDDDVRQREEPVSGLQRLLGQHVERRAGEASRLAAARRARSRR